MISFIHGTTADLSENSVTVEAGGIGFEIFMTGKALSRIKIGDVLKIHTYFHVKEDIMQLYGFFSKDDLSVFRMLLGVSGIGPKGALGVLNGLTADELRFAVLSNDVKTISRAPGIGKKTAEKLIVELKDKLSLQQTVEHRLEAGESINLPSETEEEKNEAMKQAVEALTALGYNKTDAYRAVQKTRGSGAEDVEAILKQALKNL